MTRETQTPYDLIWNQENRFAYRIAKQVLQKPKISVWLVLIPILFLYYAHKIQQYKAAVHDFSKGLMRSKILALDSAKQEIDSGKKNTGFQEAFDAKDLADSPNAMQVKEKQITEVELLKSHYEKLLRQQGSTYPALIRKAYRTAAEYRTFLNRLAEAEKAVHDAVLRAYHPSEEAQNVTKKMQKAAMALRQEEVAAFFR
jgi:hypothetical protein